MAICGLGAIRSSGRECLAVMAFALSPSSSSMRMTSDALLGDRSSVASGAGASSVSMTLLRT
jgi:hypothetical protein